MDPETQRLLSLLKVCLKILNITNREIARRLEMSPSYVSKLLSGASELRLDHVIRICRAADLEPAEFFSLAYPRQTTGRGTLAASKLRELLQTVMPSTPAPPPPKPSYTEDEVQEMLRATLERMLDRRTGT